MTTESCFAKLNDLTDLDHINYLIVGTGPGGVAVAERLLEITNNGRVVCSNGEVCCSLVTSIIINLTIYADVLSKPLEVIKSGKVISTMEVSCSILLVAAEACLVHIFVVLMNGISMIGLLGRWPQNTVTELPYYYTMAEHNRRVSASALNCLAQTWASDKLGELEPYPPPVGV